MKIRERYITKTLLSFTLVVLVIWLGVYSFFNFISEMSSIGQLNYTSLEALRYIALQVPEVAYRHASPVILLGCVLGMVIWQQQINYLFFGYQECQFIN